MTEFVTRHPIYLLGAWFISCLAVGALIPALMFVADMVGGLIGVGLLAMVAFGALGQIGFVCFRIYGRPGPKLRLLAEGALTLGVIVAGYLALRPMAELSWQLLNGPRDVPIWSL